MESTQPHRVDYGWEKRGKQGTVIYVGGPFRSYAGNNVVAAIAIVATRALVVSQPLRHR